MKNIIKIKEIIKHIKTMFYNLLCVSLKSDSSALTEKDLCENEKIGKFEKNKKYQNNMSEFDEILNRLKKHSGNLEYKTHKLILDYQNGKRKTWIITTNEYVYFIRKVGDKIYSSKTKKSDFTYQIETIDENYGKLYVNGITTPITYDKYLSGVTSTFSNFLNDMRK